MKPFILGIATAGLLVSSSLGFAQTTQRTAPTGSVSTMSPSGASNSGAAGSNTTAMAGTANGAAASGDNNQAVATTAANSPLPAKGANSFTMAQAKSRIEKDGFSNVGDLTKDGNGVWHGSAQKAGNTTGVWLDYKGNVGVSK